jgi:AcrR family transcriptional regulator/DNA-binding MarR family transcriptional regulator
VRSSTGSARSLTVAQAQRTRIVVVAQQLLCDAPAEALSIGAICAAGGVSRSTFYAAFSDRNELFLAVFDDATARAGRAMAAAREAEPSWIDGVRAALLELLALFDEAPGLAGFLVAGSLAGDDMLLAHRTTALSVLARALEQGSPSTAMEALPAPFDGEALVGAIVAVLHSRLLEEPVPPLRPLCGSLMSVIVLCYFGVEVARAELARPLPRRSHATGIRLSTADALLSSGRRPPLRVTQRTIQALAAVGERPGISNRELAGVVGIRDSSQVSHLLARLRRLGMVEDTGASRGGTPKAWQLTTDGVRLLALVGASPDRTS